MTSINYLGYEFTQTDNSDRYRIYNSDGVVVEHGYEKPNMSMSEAVAMIQRYMAIRDAMLEMRVGDSE